MPGDTQGGVADSGLGKQIKKAEAAQFSGSF